MALTCNHTKKKEQIQSNLARKFPIAKRVCHDPNWMSKHTRVAIHFVFNEGSDCVSFYWWELDLTTSSSWLTRNLQVGKTVTGSELRCVQGLGKQAHAQRFHKMESFIDCWPLAGEPSLIGKSCFSHMPELRFGTQHSHRNNSIAL